MQYESLNVGYLFLTFFFPQIDPVFLSIPPIYLLQFKLLEVAGYSILHNVQ